MASVAKSPTQQRRIEYLDGLRALAAIAVLVHHAWCMPFSPQYGKPPTGMLRLTNWAIYGPFGVSVFIVLAGYSLTIAVANRDGRLRGGWLSFLQRRARRIIPPYWAALAITTVLSFTVIASRTGTHWDQSVPLHWRTVIVDFFLVQDFAFQPHNVAYTFWSIAVEWHIYFIFPLLLLVWRRWGVRAATLVGFTTGLVLAYAGFALPWLTFQYPLFYSLFALGMGTCALVARPTEWAMNVHWARWAAVMLPVIFVEGKLVTLLGPLADSRLAVGASICCLLLHVGLHPEGNLVHTVLAWRPLVFVGGFSYSLYLIHAPLLQVIWQLACRPFNLTPGQQLAVMWLIAIPICLVVSFGFHLVAERPFMSKPPATAAAVRVASLDPSSHEPASPRAAWEPETEVALPSPTTSAAGRGTMF